MSQATDHESVSIYGYSGEEIDALMTHASECVLNWGTKDVESNLGGARKGVLALSTTTSKCSLQKDQLWDNRSITRHPIETPNRGAIRVNA